MPVNNLAVLYRDQGRYAEAEPLYRRSLAISENAFGPGHTQLAPSVNGLGVIYREQGDYHRAELFFKRALTIVETALGPKHPDVTTSLESYADLLRKTGRTDEAAEKRG